MGQLERAGAVCKQDGCLDPLGCICLHEGDRWRRIGREGRANEREMDRAMEREKWG